MSSDIAISMRIRRIRNIANEYKNPFVLNIKCKDELNYSNDNGISFMIRRDAPYSTIKLANTICDSFRNSNISIDKDESNIYYRTGYSTMLYACPCPIVSVQLVNIDNSKKYNTFAANQQKYIDAIVDSVRDYVELIKKRKK